eukprot:Opistho-2@20699
MCIIFLHVGKAGDPYRLVLAANRDEFFARPSAHAHYWEEAPDILAGKDLQPGREGGTWLGVTRTGRFAALTNFREPLDNQPEVKGRGMLVSDFLQSTQDTPLEYAGRIAASASEYAGFNLIIGDFSQLNSEGIPSVAYVSNRSHPPFKELGANSYGLCNATLDIPWPKVSEGRHRFCEIIRTHTAAEGDALKDAPILVGDLLALMADKKTYADDLLPATGVGIEWERKLSGLFVTIPEAKYGTRATSVLIVLADGTAHFCERSLDPTGSVGEWKDNAFVLTPGNGHLR